MNTRFWLSALTALSVLVSPVASQEPPPAEPEPPEQEEEEQEQEEPDYRISEHPLYDPETDQVAVFYVATWGDPDLTWHENTRETPFLTLDQARLEVRNYVAANGGPQKIQVRVDSGTYSLTEPVVFTNEDSGWPGMPIEYVGWEDGNPDILAGDVLFSGGVEIQSSAWIPTTLNGTAVWWAPVPSEVTDVRDVWVNNRRMIRARFPNAATGCENAYPHPRTPPCRNKGFLRVDSVSAPQDSQTGIRYQEVVVRVPEQFSYTIPTNINWSHGAVEVVGHHHYVNPHQRIRAGEIVSGTGNTHASLQFPVTSWSTGNPPPNQSMDLGAFGVFRWDLAEPHVAPGQPLPYDFPLAGLRVFGNSSGAGTQVYLTNDAAFLDSDFEWYFDDQTRRLYLRTCDTYPPPTVRVVVPVVQQLLILDEAAHLVFHNFQFAYTYQPLPNLADGETPGYTSVQAGMEWIDGATFDQVTPILPGAVMMKGSLDCVLQRSRVAHTGGSGVAIATKRLPIHCATPYQESHHCGLRVCEVFDVGGVGVHIGDQHARFSTWGGSPNECARDPSEQNFVINSKVDRFGVVYKDSAGVYLGHTRDALLWRNEVSYGNWTGVSIGTLQRRKWTGSLGCEGQLWPQNTEGTTVKGNRIHHVMLRLTDGGGIYTMGSHVPSSITGKISAIEGNYIHEIAMNPYYNAPPLGGVDNVHGLYFEMGSSDWTVSRNYVAETQFPFRFAVRGRFYGDQCDTNTCPTCPSLCYWPGIYTFKGNCSSTQAYNEFGAAAWPVEWDDCCNGVPYTFSGQTWLAGAPNYWRNGQLQNGDMIGPYGQYAFCRGRHGMPGSTEGNRQLQHGENSPQAVFDIIGSAGPEGHLASWFATPKQVHRLTLCGGADFVEAEMP